MKIIKNRARCKNCGDIIESYYRNDIKSCRCGAITIDGGHDYIRRGYDKRENLENLSIMLYDMSDPDDREDAFKDEAALIEKTRKKYAMPDPTDLKYWQIKLAAMIITGEIRNKKK